MNNGGKASSKPSQSSREVNLHSDEAVIVGYFENREAVKEVVWYDNMDEFTDNQTPEAEPGKGLPRSPRPDSLLVAQGVAAAAHMHERAYSVPRNSKEGSYQTARNPGAVSETSLPSFDWY